MVLSGRLKRHCGRNVKRSFRYEFLGSVSISVFLYMGHQQQRFGGEDSSMSSVVAGGNNSLAGTISELVRFSSFWNVVVVTRKSQVIFYYRYKS